MRVTPRKIAGRRRSPSGGNYRIDNLFGVDFRTRSWVGDTYCELVIYTEEQNSRSRLEINPTVTILGQSVLQYEAPPN